MKLTNLFFAAQFFYLFSLYSIAEKVGVEAVKRLQDEVLPVLDKILLNNIEKVSREAKGLSTFTAENLKSALEAISKSTLQNFESLLSNIIEKNLPKVSQTFDASSNNASERAKDLVDAAAKNCGLVISKSSDQICNNISLLINSSLEKAKADLRDSCNKLSFNIEEIIDAIFKRYIWKTIYIINFSSAAVILFYFLVKKVSEFSGDNSEKNRFLTDDKKNQGKSYQKELPMNLCIINE